MKCDFCSRLLAFLSSTQQEELLSGSNIGNSAASNSFTYFMTETPRQHLYGGHSGSFRVHIMFDPDISERLQAVGRKTQTNSVYPSLFLEIRPVRSPILPLSPSSSTTNSDESWTSAREWIHTCVKEHQTCNFHEADTYPTRLLHIDDRNDKLHLRLASSSQEDLRGPYATLSHCWGGLQIFTLSTFNYEQLLDEIPFDQLSKTFQEATEVALRLGIHLLWIDSLCIMQDREDTSDWRRESRKMRAYYGNAFINISATASADGSQGLYRERDPNQLRHTRISLPATENHASGLYEVFDISHWDHDLDESVLNTRAWVLQERLLAPRVLHFGQDQLLWECREFTASEMYAKGLPNCEALVHRNLFKDLNPKSSRNQKLYAKSTDDQIAHLLWENVKKVYSKCHLTRTNDKALAMSGIAEHFARFLSDECVFGMWLQQLPHQLLWRVTNVLYPSTHELTTDMRQFPVPSFSWLSVNCPLDNNVREWILDRWKSEIFVDIHAIDGCEGNQEYTVDNLASILRLTGNLIKCQLVLGEHGLFYAYIDGSILTHRVKGESIYLDRCHPALQVHKDEFGLFFLPVRFSWTRTRRKKDSIVEGLLLEQLKDREVEYRRIGYMSVDEIAGIKRLAKKDENISRLLSKGSKAKTAPSRSLISIV